MRAAKPSGSGSNSKSIRADNGSMFPPVTGTCHSFQITPHSTCIAVCVRISWWRRSQSISPLTVAPTAGSGPPSTVCHTTSPESPYSFFTADTGMPASVPVSLGWPPPVG